MEPVPQYAKAAGEVVGTRGHPGVDGFRSEPSPAANFADLEGKWTFMMGPVNPAEFPAGFRGGLQTQDALRRRAQSDAKFLPHFPHGACVVGFPGVEVTRGRGIPDAGPVVLVKGALLQEVLAPTVDQQHVHRAVAEV